MHTEPFGIGSAALGSRTLRSHPASALRHWDGEPLEVIAIQSYSDNKRAKRMGMWIVRRRRYVKKFRMTLENKLNIANQVELAKAEEKISKQKAKRFFDSDDISKAEIGTFTGLSFIHAYLFEDVYEFAGKIREVSIAKGNFRFVPLMYLKQSLKHINQMPQSNFDEIIEKYVEMNIAHPFREGNGRAARIWLDLILKKEIKQVVDWSLVNKDDYLSAMQRSVVKDIEIKALLKEALTGQIHDREIYMKGIDASYYYEGYSEFKTEDL